MRSHIRSGSGSTLLFAASLVFATGIAGCKVTGDIGAECTLVKAVTLPDGGLGTENMREGELPYGRDVISFGSTACEDFVCIRHRFTEPSGNPETIAMGKCSQRGCSPTDPQACEGVSPQADLTGGPFTCRPLLLDEETLAAICSTDPEMCNQLFGGQTSPYFCAQGADAGT